MMLILRRKIDEKVLVGDDIVVTILEIETKRVKLGFTAPSNVKILRNELQTNDDENEYDDEDA